jgi:formylglycine-generating enzyme required for sulfatase activity
MVPVAPGEASLQQPIRPHWPPPVKESILVEPEPGFCIGERPVTRTEYSECVEQARCSRQPLERAEKSPVQGIEHYMSWVTWHEADDYCAHHGWSLPAIVQWERAMKLLIDRRVAFPAVDPLYEWTADPFPARVFNRGLKLKSPAGEFKAYHVLLNKRIEDGRRDVPAGDLSSDPERLDFSWNKREPNKPWEKLGFRCVAPLD